MARALENAAREQKSAEEQRREQEEQRLREEQRRLRRQLAQNPSDEELQRRLQRNQRELQRLEREKQAHTEQQRQLQRLQRELERAAAELRQKLSPEALQQLAQAMQQMQNEITKLGNQARAQIQIAEIKEVLRRLGRSSGTGQEGAAATGRKGRGQNGQDKQAQQLRQFEERAGGKSSNALLLGGQSTGDVHMPLPLPMGSEQRPESRGDGEPLPGHDGIGQEHDASLFGDATKLVGQRHETRVQGQLGTGPSRSETILGSAEKGFASSSYKRVYGDYQSVVEEVMSKERVPPGYRFYIKRYFELIKPRE
jgi:hypothetical protein